mgnify:CR=1 FL=1
MPHFSDRLIAFLVEQTGLPKEEVEKVIDAQLCFYIEHPEAMTCTGFA